MKTIKVPLIEKTVLLSLMQKQKGQYLQAPEVELAKRGTQNPSKPKTKLGPNQLDETLVSLEEGDFAVAVTCAEPVEVRAAVNGRTIIDTVVPPGSHLIQETMHGARLVFGNSTSANKEATAKVEAIDENQDLQIVLSPSREELAKQVLPITDEKGVDRMPAPYVQPVVVIYRPMSGDNYLVALADNFDRLIAPEFDADEDVMLDVKGNIQRRATRDDGHCNHAP